jgi:hypothetical protein
MRPLCFLMIVLSGCASAKRPVAPDAATRNVGVAYYRLLSTYRDISSTAQRVADRQVPSSEWPQVFQTFCERQCDAAYFRCVMASMPTVPIPGMDERAPKDFPFDIPECDTDCSHTVVSSPPMANCDKLKQDCQLRCDCARVR